MFAVTLKPQKHIVQYTEKWRGYTARVDFKELSKYQKEMHEHYNNEPITKCIVRYQGKLAWRYLKDSGKYAYHIITKPVPEHIFRKYYIQNIIASNRTWLVR